MADTCSHDARNRRPHARCVSFNSASAKEHDGRFLRNDENGQPLQRNLIEIRSLGKSMRKILLVGLGIASAMVLAPGFANALPVNDGACFAVMGQPLPCANVRGRVFVSGDHVYVFPVCVYIGDVTQCPVGFTDVPLPAALPFYGPNQDCYIYFYEGGFFEGYYLVCEPSFPGFPLPAPIPQHLPPLPPLPLP